MKYNRILLLSVLFLAVFSLSGCMDVKDMTEEESDMVAEFSAGVLLRYSDTYQWRLITREQRQAAGETSSPAPEATITPSEGPQAADNVSGAAYPVTVLQKHPHFRMFHWMMFIIWTMLKFPFQTHGPVKNTKIFKCRWIAMRGSL